MKYTLLSLLLGGCQLVFPREEGARSCPAGYATIDPMLPGQYRFVLDEPAQTRWPLAEGECVKDGPTSHLAVVGSKASATVEATLLFREAMRLYGSTPDPHDIFIGLSNSSGDFKWVTDEPLDIPPPGAPPWGTGEPGNQEPNAACAEIDIETGTLVTTTCDVSDAYVCECDDFPEDLANF